MPDATTALQFRDVEKQYGALRPLRILDLRISAGSCAALVGFDPAAAEAFVSLATGAALPEKGHVACLGQLSATLADSQAWLALVERVGIVSSRVVLLEAMTIIQNLALPFDLEFDPIPANVLSRVRTLAAETGVGESMLNTAAGEADPNTRARVVLARALALDPELLLLEHPTAALKQEEAKAYAALLKHISDRRRLTTVALTMDEKFASALGGRVLTWRPATGELKERRGWLWASPSS